MDTGSERALEVLDIDRAISRVGGDLDFLLELVGIIRAACPALLDNARRAVACGDLPTVEKAARLFRAAADNLSAKAIYDAALKLETTAQRRAFNGTKEACNSLEEELVRLTPRLAAFEDSLWFAQSGSPDDRSWV